MPFLITIHRLPWNRDHKPVGDHLLPKVLDKQCAQEFSRRHAPRPTAEQREHPVHPGPDSQRVRPLFALHRSRNEPRHEPTGKLSTFWLTYCSLRLWINHGKLTAQKWKHGIPFHVVKVSLGLGSLKFLYYSLVQFINNLTYMDLISTQL